MARDMVSVRRPAVNQFTEEPDVRIGRSQFNRSHGLKTTFDASYLVPILVEEILPGDTFTCRLNGFCRIFSPLDAPLMDNIELETFFFFVPNRLVWTNWTALMGEHDAAGAQDTDYTVPILAASGGVNHNAGIYSGLALAAHFGLPHGLNFTEVDVSALPFRAYTLIYNEWFRDQNLIDEKVIPLGDGPDTIETYYNLLRSAKKHDYFTSCLPYLQKGAPVEMPLGGTARLKIPTNAADIDVENVVAGNTKLEIVAGYLRSGGSAGGANFAYVDLAEVSGGLAINDLRESVAIQRLLERDARGGTRYVESIKAHFGVNSPDYRLQRPEFLGGGKAFINVSPVANTSATATEDQGELRGIGTGVISGHGWAKSFTEHGYVLGLIRARGDLTYFQGLDRHWSRSTRYDFYFPALANLGEQAVLNKELWVSNSAVVDDAVFGYQERWSEYRFKKSEIHGVLNPDATSSLSYWHVAEDFASLPSLNGTFIADNTPMDRVTTVDSQPDFLLDLWFDLKAARPLPVHSIPGLSDGRF